MRNVNKYTLSYNEKLSVAITTAPKTITLLYIYCAKNKYIDHCDRPILSSREKKVKKGSFLGNCRVNDQCVWWYYAIRVVLFFLLLVTLIGPSECHYISFLKIQFYIHSSVNAK